MSKTITDELQKYVIVTVLFIIDYSFNNRNLSYFMIKLNFLSHYPKLEYSWLPFLLERKHIVIRSRLILLRTKLFLKTNLELSWL